MSEGKNQIWKQIWKYKQIIYWIASCVWRKIKIVNKNATPEVSSLCPEPHMWLRRQFKPSNTIKSLDKKQIKVERYQNQRFQHPWNYVNANMMIENPYFWKHFSKYNDVKKVIITIQYYLKSIK
jgi:hypothetical protein